MNPLEKVQSWLYYLGEVSPDRRAQIANSDVDLVVVDFADGNQTPHTAAEISALRGTDADRLIVSYLSIGEAEEYRTYWQQNWTDNPPAFLAEPNPEWQDNYKVAYWDPAWKKIVFDQIDVMVENGFNGLYLDIIDAYGYWQQRNPEMGAWYRQQMITFVGEIRAHAHAKLAEMGSDRTFAIIGQNGEDLAAYPEYLSVVDGIGKEDLYYYYPNGAPDSFTPVPNGWLSGSQALLEQAHAAGVEVFVVEYIPPADRGAIDLNGMLSYLQGIDAPLYVASERDLSGIYEIYGSNTGTPGQGITVTGTGGDDDIDGTSGDDVLRGRAGDDTISGGGGDDRLVGNAGRDVLLGGRGDDVQKGRNGNDFLAGHNGNDRLLGGNGNDRLLGGNGNDRLLGGNGNDRLLGGNGNDRLRGGGKNDTLHGGMGHDNINGGSGADRIIGASGDDELSGGAGADVFVFRGTWGWDVISDFEVGIDRIRLRNAGAFQSVDTAEGILLDFGHDVAIELLGVQQSQVDDLF